MAKTEITDFLSACPSPETGCFAGDPAALSNMLQVGDAVIRMNYEAIADAAAGAAVAGTPIEEATYHYTKISEESLNLSPEAISVLEHGDGDVAQIARRIARCAYACGATEIGCPLRTAPEANDGNETRESDPVEYEVY